MSVQRDLVGFTANGLPRLFPDETLYGWCARYFRLSGLTDPRLTGKILFGNGQAKYLHDFPIALAHFDNVTQQTLGQADQILLHHTLAAYHRPFMDREAFAKALVAMQLGTLKEVRFAFSLAKSGWRIAAPLKACPECMKEERHTNHTSYWHLAHQFPSTYVCLRHHCPLLILRDEAHVRPSAGWWLPANIPLHLWHQQTKLPSHTLSQLIDLAEWSNKLTSSSVEPLVPRLMRYCYLFRAKELGWMAFDGSLRFKALREQLWESYSALCTLPGLGFIGEAQDESGGFIGQLLRRSSSTNHPFKHIVMMAFMFENVGAFVQRLNDLSTRLNNAGEASLEQELHADQSRLQHLIAGENLTLTAAAQQIGITPMTAHRFANKTDISYRKRPRFFNAEFESKLVDLIEKGAEPESISEKLGISTKYIRTYLAEHPAIRSRYKELLRANELHWRRQHFLTVLEENEGIPIKRIRKISGNGFEWLLRNDLPWLREQLPGLWHRPKMQSSYKEK
jgi:hypothetical protein